MGISFEERCFIQFLKIRSIERALRKFLDVDTAVTKNALHTNDKVFAPIEFACKIFNIQLANDPKRNDKYERLAEKFNIERVPSMDNSVSLSKFIKFANKYPNNFTTQERFDKIKDQVEKGFDPDEEAEKLKDLFETTYKDAKANRKVKSLEYSEKLPKARVVIESETVHSTPKTPRTTPPKAKPKLDLSGVVFSKTPEEIAKSKLSISSSQDNDIPERNVFNRIDVHDRIVNTAKRNRAIGNIEGLEADGRIYRSEIPLYSKALNDLNNNVNILPKPGLVRAGDKTKRALQVVSNRFHKWR